MKLKFLGTSGAMGIPIWSCNCKTCSSEDRKNKRYRPSLMVEIDDNIIIIDFGQDFRNQLIENKIAKIDYAFLTHTHGDHCNGSEQLSAAENCIFEAPKDVLEEFFDRQGSSREWLATRNETIKIREFCKKQIGNVEIDTIKLEHQKDYLETPVPCYGYIFRSSDFSFAYLSDYNKILETEKCENLDLIISDASGMENSGLGHVGVKGALEIYKEYEPKKMILTHIKHTTEHYELQEYVSQFGNIEVAYDGMEIQI
ncbi:MAG: MBL fold metallo-hydrolase [Oscillospiraceae bacterium]|nr:MBL fold metallo-hydrolase [Oscillospiraceae bacterium]